MMQYEVTVLIDASRSATVEANSPAEAADKALEEHGFPSICHQCAGELNVGDAGGAIVYDSECETLLLDTTYHAERIAALEAEIARLRAAPTPPAQAADSVQEDAALWFAERDNVLHSFWVLLGEAEVHADNDNNPLLKHQVEEFYRQWNALNGTTLNPRWVSRAARKQGGA